MKSEKEIKQKIEELNDRLRNIYSDFQMWEIGYGLQDKIEILKSCLNKTQEEIRNNEVLMHIGYQDCEANKSTVLGSASLMRGCDRFKSKLMALQWMLGVKEEL